MGPAPANDPPGMDERDERCAQVVIGTFNAALSVSGRATAFGAAVRVYRERNPDVSAEAADRTVVRIIGQKA